MINFQTKNFQFKMAQTAVIRPPLPIWSPKISPNGQKKVNQSDLEQELNSRGFVLTERIVIQDEKGQSSIQYVKVITNRGQRAFVELNSNGVLQPNKNQDIVMSQIDKPSIVPFSVKNGSLELASTITQGVAFECQDEICFLHKNEELVPVETVFTSNSPITQVGTVNSISYPIVRMSEILVNPGQVIENIYQVSKRLKSENRRQCREKTVETNEGFGQLSKEYSRMIITYEFALEILKNNINFIEKYRQQRNENVDERIITDLSTRYDKMDDLIKMCDKLNQFLIRFDQLTDDMKAITSFIDDGYSEFAALNN